MKITIEFEGSHEQAVVAATTIIKNCKTQMKHDKNVKITFEDDFKKGVLTQPGICIGFLEVHP